MDIIEALRWRYATKKMTGQTVPKEIINKIIEAAPGTFRYWATTI